MVVINFAYSLTDAQLVAVEPLTGQSVKHVVDVKTQLDYAQPFVKQVRALVKSAGLSPEQWQTAPLLVGLPSLNVIAALNLAELHGLMGYFPSVLRLRPIVGTTPSSLKSRKY
jgi:hypothetical protein